MRLTEELRTRLVQKPLKKVTRRAARTLTALGELAEKGKAVRAVRGALRKNEQVAASARARYQDIKTELEKVIAPAAKQARPVKKTAPEQTPPQKKRATDKPMPEMIRAKSGGKRLPAAMAKRAVRKAGDDFKPKKGQKKRHH